MADLSKIKLNGVDYNLKDAVARGMIPTVVSDLENDASYVVVTVNGTTLYITHSLENGDGVSY